MNLTVLPVTGHAGARPAPGEPQVMHDVDMTSVVKDLLAVDHGDLDLFVVGHEHREEAGPVILDG
jgi:hypothetical protein